MDEELFSIETLKFYPLFSLFRQLGPVSDFMVNSYCENLEDTFAQMVYYGVLKEEDAQCFGVASRIGYDAFVLVTGAILLAFLSSFVCKAFVQYLYDGNPSELRLKGSDDSTVRLPDERSQSNDDDEVTDVGVVTNIHQVPVLFTDTFRWMMKSSNSGDKTMFADPDNSHWSLPEATVVASENLSPDARTMKRTSVHGLASAGKADMVVSGDSTFAGRGSPHQMSQGSIGLVSTISFDSYQSSLRKIDLDYNEDMDERHSYRLSRRQGRLKSERREPSLSLEQQSVSSKMDSIGSSSNGETFDPSVLSVNTKSSIQSPPTEAFSNTRSPRSLRKTPPPAKYRLAAKSLKKPPPSYPSTSDSRSTCQQQGHAKKPLPESSTHVSTCRSECASFADDDEYSVVKSISDIVNEVDTGSHMHFEDDSFSEQRSII